MSPKMHTAHDEDSPAPMCVSYIVSVWGILCASSFLYAPSCVYCACDRPHLRHHRCTSNNSWLLIQKTSPPAGAPSPLLQETEYQLLLRGGGGVRICYNKLSISRCYDAPSRSTGGGGGGFGGGGGGLGTEEDEEHSRRIDSPVR
jgi:hypothetical protein